MILRERPLFVACTTPLSIVASGDRPHPMSGNSAIRILADIPTDNQPALNLALSWGLKVTGILTRMTRGPKVAEDVARIWASSGPEKG